MPLDLKERLGTKVGPLPAIVWASMAGGTYVVYRYWKASKTPVTSVNAIPDSIPDYESGGVGDADNFANGYGNAAGSYAYQPSSQITNVETQPATNVDWGKRAVNWLIAQGMNPQDASTAISSYLYQTGQALNSTQSAMLNEALNKLGAPPEGVLTPPPTTTPTPPPTTTNPPPVNETWTASGGYGVHSRGTHKNSSAAIFDVGNQINASPMTPRGVHKITAISSTGKTVVKEWTKF